MAMTWRQAKRAMDRVDRDSILKRIGLEERSPAGDFFGGLGLFAIGILVGAGLGLMFAPARGDEMRSKVTDAWKNRRAGEDDYRNMGASSGTAQTPML
jgi:hypothetical protein